MMVQRLLHLAQELKTDASIKALGQIDELTFLLALYCQIKM